MRQFWRRMQWRTANAIEGLVARQSISRHREQDKTETLGVVIAAWDTDRTGRVLEELVGPLARVLSSRNVRVHAVVVRNRDIPIRLPQPLAEDGWVLDGSNEFAEFSAYNEGVRSCRAAREPAAFLVLNDRALSYGHPYLNQLSRLNMRMAARIPAVSGSIESFRRKIMTPQGVLTTWCRTNLIWTGTAGIEQVGGFVGVDAEAFDREIPEEYPGPSWTVSTWLGAEYGTALTDWLTAPGGWYRAEPLGPRSWPTFRSKLRAILNEHSFSIRALAGGVALIGLRQLACLSAASSHDEPIKSWVERYVEEPFAGEDRTQPDWSRLAIAAASLVGGMGMETQAGRTLGRALERHIRSVAQ